jgi:hypothetical protein
MMNFFRLFHFVYPLFIFMTDYIPGTKQYVNRLKRLKCVTIQKIHVVLYVSKTSRDFHPGSYSPS